MTTARVLSLAAFVAAVSPGTGCRPGATTATGIAPGDTTTATDDGLSYFPGATWRHASQSSLGLNASALTTLQNDVRNQRYGTIDAVVIVRRGYVALEFYNGWSPSRVHTVQSVTKSVTSLMFGIAASRVPADVARLDRPVLDAFPQYTDVQNVDARKRALTLGELLTMRTSMDFWEDPYPGSPLDQLNRSSGDWVKLVLDRQMTGDPGTTWAYNSGAAIVTCGVVRSLVNEGPGSSSYRRSTSWSRWRHRTAPAWTSCTTGSCRPSCADDAAPREAAAAD